MRDIWFRFFDATSPRSPSPPALCIAGYSFGGCIDVIMQPCEVIGLTVWRVTYFIIRVAFRRLLQAAGASFRHPQRRRRRNRSSSSLIRSSATWPGSFSSGLRLNLKTCNSIKYLLGLPAVWAYSIQFNSKCLQMYHSLAVLLRL